MSNRLIDKVDRPRKKPMRVLVLGMCRTGTTSMSIALRKLGYTPHQMREVLVNPKELDLWQEAINTTLLPPQDRLNAQRNLAPYGRPEFDKLLADSDAVMDLPGCIFAPQLIEAYPDAKVILTTRDYALWEKSMRQSIWCLCTWWLFAFVRYFNISRLAPLTRLIHSAFRVHNGNNYGGPKARKAYDGHYDTVRSLVVKDRLLEVDPDEMSWEPLCQFLGNAVPSEPFPRTAEEQAMRQYLTKAWWSIIELILTCLAIPGSVILFVVVASSQVDALRELRNEYVLRPIKGFLKR